MIRLCALIHVQASMTLVSSTVKLNLPDTEKCCRCMFHTGLLRIAEQKSAESMKYQRLYMKINIATSA